MGTMDANREFWRWKESKWIDPEITDCRSGLVTAGVDIGSTSAQAVITVDGKLYAYASMRTGSDSPGSAVKVMDWALEETGLKKEDLRFTVGTGYGRVNVPFADKTVTEISCHARGANYIYGPSVRTLLDMGGQDCKAISVNEKGSVTSFMMNDKCAAGTGRGMEVIATLLAIPVEELGARSFEIDEEPPPVSSICVVFAKKEVASLMHSGWSKEKVLASYCSAMALRVYRLLDRNGIEKDFAITGGIAKNIGVTRRIERLMGIEALRTDMDTQIAGALGAALIGRDLYLKRQAKAQNG